MTSPFDQLDPKAYIFIKGARVHNLKNIDVALPRNKFVVLSGLSGSGKSSLAFSTLYAEGQRRYVESLSSYARQFLGKLEKPDVDYIKGIAPAIAIEQKVNTSNSRSTVGTATEIYDYMKLLFARVGKTISPVSGNEIKQDTVEDVVDHILKQTEGRRIFLLVKVNLGKKGADHLKLLIQQGFSRVLINNEVQWLEEIADQKATIEHLDLIIDRYQVGPHLAEETSRIADSIETAFYEGKGKLRLLIQSEKKTIEKEFSNAFEEGEIQFIEPSVNLFTFNNPIGACPRCEGFGKVIGIDEDLVIPNKSMSIYQDAIACWKGEKLQVWKKNLIRNADAFDLPIHKPILELSNEQYALLWEGNQHFKGLNQFFDYLSKKSYKIQYRVMLARYRGRTKCPDCKGSRLRIESSFVKVGGRSIQSLVDVSILELKVFFEALKLDKLDQEVSKRILVEINNRLDYLINVGVGYLNLNRPAATLSGGESQRINLATSLGSSLVGSMYILDEPSIGLHPKDTERLIDILRSLQKLGNTVIVVEHDEDIISAADEVLDLGPEAGSQGGELVFQGSPKSLMKANTLTAQYLSDRISVAQKKPDRKFNNFIEVFGARQHNLKGIDVRFPLHALTAISGVSGSGKSTLVREIIYPAIQKHLGEYGDKVGSFLSIGGALKELQSIQFIDQNPIGKSSRSNPVTYIKAYDEIRKLYASLGLSKSRGYKPAFFSFNVEGGRCEMCKGEGEITEEMQFMADVHIVCETCEGKRFKEEVLEVTFHGKNIAELLDLTVEDAVLFFNSFEDSKDANRVADRLQPLLDVGLGYVKLGQASGTLSGGEAQRIKLATYLGKGGQKDHCLFIFDEPTTGLHFHDISKLLKSFNALLDKGHTIVVIEHNPEVIKQADWVIDLGPEGGDNGGGLMYQGNVEGLKKSLNSITASYI